MYGSSIDSGVAIESHWLKTLTGTRIRVRTPGHETENRLTIIDYIEPPNTEPPIFTRHEFIEVFYVLSGTLMFQFLDEERFAVSTGQQVTCPSWKPHSFWNETDQQVSVLLICTPAGLDLFFTESDQLRRDFGEQAGRGAEWDKAMAGLRDRHGLEHVGLPPERGSG